MNNETFGKAQLQRGYYNNDGRAVVIPILPNETYKEVSGKTNMLVSSTHWVFNTYPLFHSKNKPREEWEITLMKTGVILKLATECVENIREYRTIKDYKEANKWYEKLKNLGYDYDAVFGTWYRL